MPFLYIPVQDYNRCDIDIVKQHSECLLNTDFTEVIRFILHK